MISTFDMFKIGIGPSSSHTLAPMKAAGSFIDVLVAEGKLNTVTHIRVDLYGSLSLTGKGHQTDQAIILGLAGEKPDSVVIEEIPHFMKTVDTTNRLALAQGKHEIQFSHANDIVFNKERLPLHENGMTITACANDAVVLKQTYYSVGGGVVVREEDFGKIVKDTHIFPYPFAFAKELLALCHQQGVSISTLVLENELSLHSRQEVLDYYRHIWEIMQECIQKGLETEGLLPGPMRLPRRAPHLNSLLTSFPAESLANSFQMLDWVSTFALAASEVNAAGGRVVTAPTNGACGIIPAVFAYYNKFVHSVTDDDILKFFLCSGAIGLLYRMNASLSGAEVGCQGEVGVACSMAAAGLAELFGASPEQVCIAAGIGMEHNLGLTCDPVGGQVQIPCIERNAINAVKAITAARMSIECMPNPALSLDQIIAAMLATGKDMNAKYRETALGGLAKVGFVGCS